MRFEIKRITFGVTETRASQVFEVAMIEEEIGEQLCCINPFFKVNNNNISGTGW